MKKFVKAAMALLLCCIMVLGMIGTGGNLDLFSEKACASTNGVSRNQAVEWIKDKGNSHWGDDVDKDSGCQCVDLIKAYYSYLGQAWKIGNAWEYANTYMWPSGWTQASSPQPGDIFVVGATQTFNNGHVGLIYEVSGNTMYTVETNVVSPYKGEMPGANAQNCTRPFSDATTFIHPDFDTEAPTISDINVKQILYFGYYISCTVSDNVGVAKVQYQTWTEKNGTDDLTDSVIDGNISDGKVRFYISRKDHNKETGKYITHISVEDTSGNRTEEDVPVSLGGNMLSRPRYSVLALDASGSMYGTPAAKQKEAAIEFCKALLDNNDKDYIAIVTFSSSATKTCDFTNDIDLLTTYINKTNANGGTNTYAALDMADELLTSVSDSSAVKNIILCSDGLPSVGETTTDGPYTYSDYDEYKYANSVYNLAADLKQDYGIYTLGFFHNLSGSELAFGQRFMNDIQNEGYFEVTDVNELEDTFVEIAGDIDGSNNFIVVISKVIKYVVLVIYTIFELLKLITK